MSICMGMLVSGICMGMLVSGICMGMLVSGICMGMLVTGIYMGMLVSGICMGMLVSGICMGLLVSSICMGMLVSSICMGMCIFCMYVYMFFNSICVIKQPILHDFCYVKQDFCPMFLNFVCLKIWCSTATQLAPDCGLNLLTGSFDGARANQD